VLSFGTSRDPRNAQGRFSGSSGGWDWGPYTSTNTGAQQVGGGFQFTFSKGLWRDVYLAVASSSAPAIEHLAPYTFYLGPYPTAPLTDATAGPWRVDVRLQLRLPAAAAAPAHGTLTVAGSWGASNATQLTLPPGANASSALLTLSLAVPLGAVQLWWPNGLGQQALHSVSAQWTPSGAAAPTSATSRTLGFRHFAIVTGDDSTPAALAGKDGSGGLTVRWKVNGANFWARGADLIPLEVLDGRSSDAAIVALLHSAAAAHMNVLRVDGITEYFPDVFYATADALGLLVYQDMQYSQGNPAPQATALQTAELLHTVRRLAHHPSLAVYDGCNECGGHGLYASFVMTTVAAEDASRPPWPASPSNGWLSGVDALTSLPNGSPLGLQPSQSAAGGAGGRRQWQAAGGRAALPSSAARAAAASAAGNCTFLPNLDVCPEDPACMAMPHPSVATPSDCCSACAAAGPAACAASVFYQGQCWFKPPGASAPVPSEGRVLCWPAGTPLPPAPSLGPMPTPHSREQHGPYVHGSGFAAVNGNPTYSQIGDGPLPPLFSQPYLMGPADPSFAVSEFGCPASSSFLSFAPTLAPEHWGLHGGAPPDQCPGGFKRNCTSPAANGLPSNRMAQRNYPMDSIVGFYFGLQVVASLEEVGQAAFQRQLYFALLAPALQQKSHMEYYRSSPTYMTLFWQLAEIWPTNGWGSLEYGTASGLTAGQVVGGGGR
jgi:beta-mannosidase